MNGIITTYDAYQHCLAEQKSSGKQIAMCCPQTGKGKDYSPINLVESALGSCMLLSMGTVATRHGINLTDTKINVEIETNKQPQIRFKSIAIVVNMPTGIAPADRSKLEQAAESCPIKHSFAEAIPVTVRYLYPGA